MPSDRQSNFVCWFLLGKHTPQDSKALEGNRDSFFRVYILDAENILAKKCKSRYLAFDLFCRCFVPIPVLVPVPFFGLTQVHPGITGSKVLCQGALLAMW